MHFRNDQMESALFKATSKVSIDPTRSSVRKRRGHKEERCWDKFTLLKVKQFSSRRNGAINRVVVLIAETNMDLAQAMMRKFVYLYQLLVKWSKMFLINDSKIIASSFMCLINSGAFFHITLELSSFIKLQYTKHVSVEMDDKSIMTAKVTVS